MRWFNDIETRYPVDTWKVDGVHLWPLIRIRMAYWLRKRNMPPQTIARKSKPLEKNPVKRLYHRLVSLLQLLFYYLPLSKKKYVFVGTFSQREKVGQIYMNKFFDPVIGELNQPEKNVAIWEYATYFSNKEYKHKKYILPLKRLTLIFTYIQKKFKIAVPKKHADLLPKFRDFVQEVEQHQELSYAKDEVSKAHKQAKSINKLSVFFEILLKKAKPKLVFILCYYSSETYPIVLACKRLKIPCADFQHGPQGKIHPAYGSWLNIAEGGFNLLPNYFLTWNQSSAEAINHGFGNSKFHRGVYFGHPWIDYWKDKKEAIINSSNQKKILFSLQPVGELLTKEEMNMIKSTQEKYVWLMRLHPRQLHQQQALEELIIQNDLKAEVKEATTKPLPSLLAQVDIHCTRSSGTTLEAAVFGVPTLLLSLSGVEYYPEEIANGFVYIPDTFDSSGFVKCLKKLDEKRKPNKYKMPEQRNYQKLLESIS